MDNFYATATYRVFKPIGEGLSAIASYVKPTDDPVEMVRVGAIRYSSTRRRTMIAKQDDIPVEVNVYDFIGNKTGMFGMTRMGKSNTMKTVAARVFAVSERRRAAGLPPVGQLILDPQGEYANPNSQDDDTALAQLGGDAHRLTLLQRVQHVASRASGDVHEMDRALFRVNPLDGLLKQPPEHLPADTDTAPADAIQISRIDESPERRESLRPVAVDIIQHPARIEAALPA